MKLEGIIVASASAAYALLYTILGGIRYAGHRSGADLGIFVQSLVSPGFANTFERGSHFTYHFSPILIVLAPLVRATHSALVLIAVQAVAGALTAPAVYLLARRLMSAHLAMLLALLTLVYPPLAGVTFTDFHENGFAPAAVAWLVWAVVARRWGIALALVVVVLSIKEDEAPVVAACGALAAVWFARRGERAGVVVACAAVVLAAAAFIGYFTVVRPLAGAREPWAPSHFYAWDRSGPGTVGADVGGRASYTLEAFAPLAFLPLATPFVVFAIPGLAEVLLSHLSITYTMGQHYAGMWIGWLLAAAVFGTAALAARNELRARRAVIAAIVLSILILAVASPTHWGHFLHAPTAEDRSLDALAARIPPEAPVGTFDEMYAHLATNVRAQSGIAGDPQYVLEDARYDGASWRVRSRPVLERDVRDGTYREVAAQDGVVLYRRAGS